MRPNGNPGDVRNGTHVFNPDVAPLDVHVPAEARGNHFYKPIIVDIDGTICDIEGRDPMTRNPRVVCWDQPAFHVVSLVNALRGLGHAIIFVSGRPETLREATIEWLRRHSLIGCACGDDACRGYVRLLMREDDTYAAQKRSDVEVKRDVLAWLRAGGVEIYMAIDDRPKVIREVWQAAGVPVVQVGRSVGVTDPSGEF